MNERERELIARLAEGTLEDEAGARSLLEGSKEARAEYRLQLDALDALSDAGPTAMDETERADLHREVWALLRSEDGDDKARSRSTTGIYGWSLAAAALFVVVGLAAVLGGGLLTGSGDSGGMETFSEVASGLSADTTAEATDSGAQADEEAALAPALQERFAMEADRLRAGGDMARTGDGEGDQESALCLTQAGLRDHEVAAVVEGGSPPIEGSYLAAVPEGEPVGQDTPIQFVDADSCTLVHTDP